jgi:acetyl-CoA carboxylase biotin carboxyl carrier protein
VSINFNELRELLGTIAQTDITELNLKSDDFELTVRKSSTEITPVVATPSVPILTTTVNASPVPVSEPTPREIVPPESTSPIVDKNLIAITSPMVGTFYRAAAPDEPPFVDVNDRIRVGQTVCIIEAMKLMNEIESETSGQIMEIVVGNGEPVEYGQTLMWIKPG